MPGKNKTRTILFIFLVSVFASMNIHAYEGLLSGQKNLKCIKTEYFDIIYPETSRESAAELYVHADDIYREICADYGINPTLRMPVTITNSTDAYNAYFTTFTYNHIVLFDTTPDDNMDVFESTICDTFKHELSHALTINMKNPFWTFMAKVFGDVVTLGDYLNMTTAIKEGAAVAEESTGGYGRLNNPYYMHTVRQAKIQETFPSQADIMGSRDIYPGGNMSYAFGGPFTKWLQDKYGMEKYAEFWYAGINTEALTYQLAFRKVYGESINTAWKEFYESLPVPENVIYAEDTESIQTVPGTSANGFLYSSLTAGKNKIAWLEERTSTVWICEADESENIRKPKKFLTKQNINSISLSRDGRYLALSFYTPNAAEVNSRVMVYDTENKSHVLLKEKSLKKPFIMQNEEGSILCAVQNHGQTETLVKYSIIEKSSGRTTRIKDVKEISRYDFPRGEGIYSPVDFGNGQFACIYRNAGKSQFRFYDSGMNWQEIDLSGYGIFVQGLSFADDSTLVFSWAREDTLPRLGRLMMNKGEDAVLELSGTDVSGGVYCPAAFNGKYFYSGNFVDKTRLFMQNQEEAVFTQTELKVNSFNVQEWNREENISKADEVLSDAENWNTVFYGKGIFAPLSYIQEYSQTGEADEIIFLGATWITSNPWDGNHFALGGGFTPWGKQKGGFMSLIRGGGESSFFNYQIIPAVLLNDGGFLQATVSSSIKTRISINNFFYLLAQDDSLLFLGHQETDRNGNYINAYGMQEKISENIDPSFYLSFYNSFSVQLSTMHLMGPGRYNTGGFSVQLNYDIASSNFIDDSEGIIMGTFEQNLYPVLLIALPRLLPFECSNRLTYNLPVKASAYFAPTDSIVLAGSVSSVLFSAEIQKGLTFFPLFFNTFTLRGEYMFNLKDSNSDVALLTMVDTMLNSPLSYIDSISVTATISGTINTGIFASSSMVQDFGLRFTYYPRDTSDKPFKLSFVTSLNF